MARSSPSCEEAAEVGVAVGLWPGPHLAAEVGAAVGLWQVLT